MWSVLLRALLEGKHKRGPAGAEPPRLPEARARPGRNVNSPGEWMRLHQTKNKPGVDRPIEPSTRDNCCEHNGTDGRIGGGQRSRVRNASMSQGFTSNKVTQTQRQRRETSPDLPTPALPKTASFTSGLLAMMAAELSESFSRGQRSAVHPVSRHAGGNSL